ncbi:MAG: cell envelope integrity protein TolA [Legionellaceae bacterium]|nr:cell envelope integrity protein TolA [Legionellaceae bacterium]
MIIKSLDINYRQAFGLALGLHLALLILLFWEPSSPENGMAAKGPVMVNLPTPSVVHAVSVDGQAVQEAVESLKQAKEVAKQAEMKQQAALQKQAEMAKQARLQEEHRLKELKIQNDTLALRHKKQLEEEQRHLKELEAKKAAEAQKLAQLQQETLKQEALRKKQALEAAAVEKSAKKKAEAAKAEAAKVVTKTASSSEKPAVAAQPTGGQLPVATGTDPRMASVIDRYKSLIVSAIGQQWILPDNVAPGLSSQFRIRLAPNGSVLEVSLLRSSGDALLDRSAEMAIHKASPLPVPSDRETFAMFRDISLTVRPENVRG